MGVFKPRLFRIAAWSSLSILAYLSLIPAEYEVRTGGPGGLEHFAAYFGTGFLFGFGYPAHHIRILLGLVLYGSLMEVLQFIPPDRHPSIDDALNSGAGAILGTMTAAFLARHVAHDLKKSSARFD